MRHIATITGIRRTHDGELVADANLRDSGLIHGMANTVDNFQMDDEILLLAIRRTDADAMYDNLSMAMEDVADSYRIDNAALFKLLDALKPDEVARVASA